MAGLKYPPLKLRSTSSIVIAAANTGRESSNNKEVTIKHQTIRRKVKKVECPLFIVIVVMVKFILLTIDLTPAKCNLKIAKSTLRPA